MTQPLTPRQAEFLTHRANGHSNQQIAQHHGLSINTVKTTLRHAYQRLGANDSAHAVALALAAGELSAHQIVIPDQQQETVA